MRLLSLQNKTESASALQKRAKGKDFGTLEVRCVHYPVRKIRPEERKRKRAFTGRMHDDVFCIHNDSRQCAELCVLHVLG